MKKCVVLAGTHFFFGVIYSLGVMLLSPGMYYWMTCCDYWLTGAIRNGWIHGFIGYLPSCIDHVSILCVDL